MKSCGRCTACCVAPAVEELLKPAWEPCSHLGCAPSACGIYAARPDSCRTFNCGWKTSPELAARFRPDRSGFIIVGRAEGLQVWELDDRKWEGSRLQRFVGNLEVEIVRK